MPIDGHHAEHNDYRPAARAMGEEFARSKEQGAAKRKAYRGGGLARFHDSTKLAREDAPLFRPPDRTDVANAHDIRTRWVPLDRPLCHRLPYCSRTCRPRSARTDVHDLQLNGMGDSLDGVGTAVVLSATENRRLNSNLDLLSLNAAALPAGNELLLAGAVTAISIIVHTKTTVPKGRAQ